MLAPFPRFLTGLKAAHLRLYRRREQSASYRPGLGQQVHNSFGATGVILGACEVSSYVDREIIQFEVGIFTIKVLPLCDLHIFQYLQNSCIIFSETPNRRPKTNPPPLIRAPFMEYQNWRVSI